MSQRLAIFDIDGTLVPGASSEVRFVRYLRKQGVLGFRQYGAYAMFCVTQVLRYRQHLMKKNKAYLSGLHKDRVRTLADTFVADDLRWQLYTPVMQRLQAHKQAGDRVVLLSGTPQFLADALAQALGADAGYGALCSCRNGIYRAGRLGRHPYGPTKVDGAQRLAKSLHLSLKDAIAYGDSAQDAYLFHEVGSAVVVQPDKSLCEAAAGEGWEVLSHH